VKLLDLNVFNEIFEYAHIVKTNARKRKNDVLNVDGDNEALNPDSKHWKQNT
jgi:hypothetical protein